MGDCDESPGEKSSKVKLALAVGREVYGAESACRTCEAISDLLKKRRLVPPEDYWDMVKEKVGRAFPDIAPLLQR